MSGGGNALFSRAVRHRPGRAGDFNFVPDVFAELGGGACQLMDIPIAFGEAVSAVSNRQASLDRHHVGLAHGLVLSLQPSRGS